VGPEQCDDGNIVDNIGCLPDCTGPISFYGCSGGSNLTHDICVPLCGDGFRISPEGCDDGDKLDNRGCSTDCSLALSTFTCSGGSDTSADSCYPICGDGF